MKHWIKTSVFVTLIFFTACHTVPETGRRSFNLMPESTIVALSRSAFESMKSDKKISSNSQYRSRVDRVCRAIVLEATKSAQDLPPLSEWEWVVFDEDDTVNAFAMPGGKIGVFTGILKLAESDDELAVVLGHEVAHVAARHGNERFSYQLLIVGGGVALGVATHDQSSEKQAAILTAYGITTTLGAALPFSRRDESEADHIGLLYSSRAGFDPRASIPFWQKMGAQGVNPPEFISTHPSHQTRIRRLTELMPEAMVEYRRAKGEM